MRLDREYIALGLHRLLFNEHGPKSSKSRALKKVSADENSGSEDTNSKENYFPIHKRINNGTNKYILRVRSLSECLIYEPEPFSDIFFPNTKGDVMQRCLNSNSFYLGSTINIGS